MDVNLGKKVVCRNLHGKAPELHSLRLIIAATAGLASHWTFLAA
jgi:hypothetical protein